MKNLIKVYDFIKNHPLTKNNRLSAFKRFITWQIVSRVSGYKIIVPFVNDTNLVTKQGLHSLTGNIYAGLMEFYEMSFLLHFLRQGDFFIDIGANAGTYTILASGAVGAKTCSVEPVPQSYEHLIDNININRLQGHVKKLNIGLGDKNEKLDFTSDLGATNRVALPNEKNLIQVEVKKLDEIVNNESPDLLKIDVEGFEMQVLKGGENVLKSSSLKAIIIELGGNGKKYGCKDEEIRDFIISKGFLPYEYRPFTRELIELNTYNSMNTIYVKDINFVRSRIENADKFSVLDRQI